MVLKEFVGERHGFAGSLARLISSVPSFVIHFRFTVVDVLFEAGGVFVKLTDLFEVHFCS